MSTQYIEFKFVEVSYAVALVIRSMMAADISLDAHLNLHVHHKFIELNGTLDSQQMWELIKCIKFDCHRYQLFYQHNGAESGIEEISNGALHSTLTLCDGNYMIDFDRVIRMIKDHTINDLYDISAVLINGKDKLFDHELSFTYEFVDLFRGHNVVFYDEDDEAIEE